MDKWRETFSNGVLNRLGRSAQRGHKSINNDRNLGVARVEVTSQGAVHNDDSFIDTISCFAVLVWLLQCPLELFHEMIEDYVAADLNDSNRGIQHLASNCAILVPQGAGINQKIEE